MEWGGSVGRFWESLKVVRKLTILVWATQQDEKVGWGRGRRKEERNFEADILTQEKYPKKKL